MNEDERRSLIEELGDRVARRQEAGDYDLPWLDEHVEAVEPPTPVDRYLQTPPGPMRTGPRELLDPRSNQTVALRSLADQRLREAITWLKLALDAEGEAREDAAAELREAVGRAETDLRALGHSHGERIHRLEDDRRWVASALLRILHPEVRHPGDGAVGLAAAECRVYSQNGEDGIIAWLFSRIGVTDRRFVEIGIGDGRECNTAALALVFGWRGLMVDAWPTGVASARAFYGSRPETRDTVTVLGRMVTRETVDPLLTGQGFAGELDLLSIDIDGNDLWVWEAIEHMSPRVVVIEYNATYGPDRSVSVPYDPGFDRLARHPSGWYHGASLRALTRVGGRLGYVLVGCDSNGVNAFFVRADSAQGVVEAVPVEVAWRPVRERGSHSTDEQFAVIAHLPLVEVG